jgi:hypothetical protein
MNIIRFSFCILLAAFICTTGCVGFVHHSDPLAGWHTASHNPDQVIENDYNDYIQKLPAKERKYAGPIEYFEDGTGQHAVLIWIGINGKVWRHILIYDTGNKRIKTIKYVSGDYAS